MSAQKLGQLQPFIKAGVLAVLSQECMANLHILGLGRPNTVIAAVLHAHADARIPGAVGRGHASLLSNLDT
jgi:hypothetical protein